MTMAGSSYGRYVAAAMTALIRARPKASAADIAKSAHDLAEAVLTEGRRRHVERMETTPEREERGPAKTEPYRCPMDLTLCREKQEHLKKSDEAEYEETKNWPREQP